MKKVLFVLLSVLVAVTVLVSCKEPGPVLLNICVYQQPSTMTYEVGDTLKLEGLKIKTVWSDGTLKDLPVSECTITPPTSEELQESGPKTFTVSYGKFKTTFTVVVAKEPSKDCLKFESTTEFTLKIPMVYGNYDTNGEKTEGLMEYSTDGITWYDVADCVPKGTIRALIDSKDNVLYVRGTGNNMITPEGISWNYEYKSQPKSVDYISVTGDIMSLLDYEDVKNASMGSYTYEEGTAPNIVTNNAGCFEDMFSEWDLSSVPTLSATELAPACYFEMFEDCHFGNNVTFELPATVMKEECYYFMFAESNITKAPALPATTLAKSCYENMFDDCTSLVTAPALPATALAESCYSEMFARCTSLTTAPALPATTLAESCYESMFEGCTLLATAPVLPATTLAEFCYEDMFYGCTELTKLPVLPATTLARKCYNCMFYGCSKIKIGTTQTALGTWSFPSELSLASDFYSEYIGSMLYSTSSSGLDNTQLCPLPGTTYYYQPLED